MAGRAGGNFTSSWAGFMRHLAVKAAWVMGEIGVPKKPRIPEQKGFPAGSFRNSVRGGVCLAQWLLDP